MSKFWIIQDENEEYEFTDVLEALDDKDKEIERLNNIINELEKWLKENNLYNTNDNILNKIKELKENEWNRKSIKYLWKDVRWVQDKNN